MTVRLEELLAAATPGPWEVNPFDEYDQGIAYRHVYMDMDAEPEISALYQLPANAALIALAPDAVRLLIDMGHNTRRMLQAYDAYCMWCDGWQGPANRRARSESAAEDWWNRFEKYRAKVEECAARLDTLIPSPELRAGNSE